MVTIDLIFGALLMIVLSALAMDITVGMMGAINNDSACRDACRAAAQTSNQAAALVAAQIQLGVHANDGLMISQPTLTASSSPDFVYNDYAGSPPANTSPYVVVTTAVTVKLPVPLVFFGKNFATNNVLRFTRRYQFPIIKEHFYG
jgi:hypothetical protein